MIALTSTEMELLVGEEGPWACVFGTIGSAVGGTLLGAGAGSVIPILGTAAGAGWGFFGGALVGLATFC